MNLRSQPLLLSKHRWQRSRSVKSGETHFVAKGERIVASWGVGSGEWGRLKGYFIVHRSDFIILKTAGLEDFADNVFDGGLGDFEVLDFEVA